MGTRKRSNSKGMAKAAPLTLVSHTDKTLTLQSPTTGKMVRSRLRKKDVRKLQGVYEIRREGKEPEIVYFDFDGLNIEIYDQKGRSIGRVRDDFEYRWIDPRYRELGLARIAFQLFEDHHATNGRKTIRTSTSSRRNAAAFWKMGYRSRKREENQLMKELAMERQGKGSVQELGKERISLSKRVKRKPRTANLSSHHRIRVLKNGKPVYLTKPIEK
tara:strand:- start:1890 stop:2537 length:648 start_codon:yes stop_codon:yes gene_type:complete